MENYTKLLNDLLKGSSPKNKYEFQVYQLNMLDKLQLENEALKKEIERLKYSLSLVSPF